MKVADQFNVQINPDNKGGSTAVVLPCAPDQFSQFIARLLGRPQELTGVRTGRFKVDKEESSQLHHLLTQRVVQQNGAQPLQFTARILFSNGTSVALNTFEDFSNYHEVRSIESVGLVLSWTFLLSFPGNSAPEKQEVEMTFGSGSGDRLHRVRDLNGEYVLSGGGGSIHYRIMHTARTWGADIESLLTHYLDNLIKIDPTIRKIVRKYSSVIAFGTGLLTFLILFAGMAISSSGAIEQQNAILVPALNGALTVPQKLDHLINYTMAARDGLRLLYTILFLMFAVVASIFAGAWVESGVDAYPPSDVVLTKRSEEKHKLNAAKYERSMRQLAASIVGAFVLAIAANFAYDFLLKGALDKAANKATATKAISQP